jgi:hypothetical protein
MTVVKRIFFLGAILCIGLYSCQKENQRVTLNGQFKEVLPVNGRSQLEFIRGNIVIKSEPGSSFKDSFSYEIGNGKIKLKPVWTNRYSATEFDYKIIFNVTFEIQNLYPSIPEFPKSYMTYKK